MGLCLPLTALACFAGSRFGLACWARRLDNNLWRWKLSQRILLLARSSSFEPAGMSKRLKLCTRSTSLQEAGQHEIEMLDMAQCVNIGWCSPILALVYFNCFQLYWTSSWLFSVGVTFFWSSWSPNAQFLTPKRAILTKNWAKIWFGPNFGLGGPNNLRSMCLN